MAPLTPADIPSLSLLYKLRKLSPASPGSPLPTTLLGPNTGTSLPSPSKTLNDRVALIRCDITTLALDAIVNAANRSLLGGGGVDGAIHRAAGPALYDECRALGGCPTGSAKITAGYALSARHIIHAVGPVYDPFDPAKSERLLTGCYTRSLELAVSAGCRSVAFSALSTGIYGYPSQEAAPAALSAIRRFLVGPEGSKLDKVVIVTFEMKDVEAYNEFIPCVPSPHPLHPRVRC
jgi:O-acetyl-ADP-ribose deacetylase (regulator of RNase III)